ncbi:uncharacterized protein BO97DRAFT_415002 [Aspergillus homomorphus CBS 101889]|uniref:Uncharacterized protein n=1 Tax=Aspergillus homomorphus (strain CBS 101889) TaxID=1450537 RepID=A0A395HV04_ASPHC|nr:hypothetical protein BO97DRAFT_415002 [Aspergillus homomorphus CBS 101889]RAL11751.1 hypothetical protein BO97DRAFT_415002 [Aspergillus homomorphus CBS 101889]
MALQYTIHPANPPHDPAISITLSPAPSPSDSQAPFPHAICCPDKQVNWAFFERLLAELIANRRARNENPNLTPNPDINTPSPPPLPPAFATVQCGNWCRLYREYYQPANQPPDDNNESHPKLIRLFAPEPETRPPKQPKPGPRPAPRPRPYPPRPTPVPEPQPGTNQRQQEQQVEQVAPRATLDLTRDAPLILEWAKFAEFANRGSGEGMPAEAVDLWARGCYRSGEVVVELSDMEEEEEEKSGGGGS